MAEIPTLNIAWQSPDRVSGLICGDDALMVYNSLSEQARTGLKYDEPTKTMIGSTPFAVANLDVLAQKYGARTPNLRDLSRPEVMRIAEDKHYIDSRNLVARSKIDANYPKNNSLLRTIYELAEANLGKIGDTPFMIEGFSFDSAPEDKNGYGLRLVPSDNFRVIQDKRLGGNYDGFKFSEVDELGLPKFSENGGSRTWWTRNSGLARLCLGRDLNLFSSNGILASSNDAGRVVFLK
ncbi:hypothetical protein J4463_02955 [Candidatus Pacearchaeota archaeon]|nr:hypothetical protein [uncultured archaeon]MBS3100150.1 hypothetical protein [Candidatus Pacearchaeota archaeon]